METKQLPLVGTLILIERQYLARQQHRVWLRDLRGSGDLQRGTRLCFAIMNWYPWDVYWVDKLKKFVNKVFCHWDRCNFDFRSVVEDTHAETIWTFDFVDMFMANGRLPLKLNLYTFCLHFSSNDCYTLFPQRKRREVVYVTFRVCMSWGRQRGASERSNLVSRASFPLTSDRKTKALGATILK